MDFLALLKSWKTINNALLIFCCLVYLLFPPPTHAADYLKCTKKQAPCRIDTDCRNGTDDCTPYACIEMPGIGKTCRLTGDLSTAPQNFESVDPIGADFVTVKWTPIAFAQQYKVFYQETGATEIKEKLVGTANTPVKIDGLKNLTEYTLWVNWCNGKDCSPPSNTITKKTAAPTTSCIPVSTICSPYIGGKCCPGSTCNPTTFKCELDTTGKSGKLNKPTGLRPGEKTSNSIKIDWNFDPNAEKYKILYKKTSDKDLLETTGPTTPIVITGLTPDTEYIIYIKACNSDTTNNPPDGCSEASDAIPPIKTSPAATANACCATGLTYDQKDNKCKSSVASLPPANQLCASGLTCQPATNTCVPGIWEQNQPPPPCKKYAVEGVGEKTESELKALKLDASFKSEYKCIEVDTAFGPIGTGPEEFIKRLLGIILSLSGGIALLLIIVSGYHLMISRGDPEKIQGAKDTLTSAIVGLLFIIFSLVILQVIGADILKIPGFKNENNPEIAPCTGRELGDC